MEMIKSKQVLWTIILLLLNGYLFSL